MPALAEQRARRWGREYETIYILRPNVDPDEADRIAARFADVVRRLDGRMVRVDNWGKRRLAYAIGGFSRGIFVYVRYVGYGDLVAEIERNLRQFDAIMRFQTVLLRTGVDPTSVQVDAEETRFARLEPSPLTDEDRPVSLARQLASVAAEVASGEAAARAELGADAGEAGAEGDAESTGAEADADEE
ncbi:MAG: 30S ribosomal protein S6 [Myxococcota bacterium]|nr:30S ribosomal protein S6 [Myxococcota bacterium]